MEARVRVRVRDGVRVVVIRARVKLGRIAVCSATGSFNGRGPNDNN